MRERVLNVNIMSVRWGSHQGNLRKTKIKEVEPYPSKLQIRDIQSMIFEEEELGLFYFNNNHRLSRKHDRPSGKWKMMTKTKKITK